MKCFCFDCVGGQRESGCFIDLTELRSLHKHTLSELSSQQISKPIQSDCTVLDSPDSCEFPEGCFSQETSVKKSTVLCFLRKMWAEFTCAKLNWYLPLMIQQKPSNTWLEVVLKCHSPLTSIFNLSKNCSTSLYILLGSSFNISLWDFLFTMIFIIHANF